MVEVPKNWTYSRKSVAPTKSTEIVNHNIWRNRLTGEIVVHYELIAKTGLNHIVEAHSEASNEASLINKIRESIAMRTTEVQDKDWIQPREGEQIQRCVDKNEAESVALSYMGGN